MGDQANVKATSKGLNDGSMFKLDLKNMRASGNAEAYLRVWLTNWQNKLTTDELTTAKRHQILWYGQQIVTPDGYPMYGIPSNKAELITVAATGKCGLEYIGVANLTDNEEDLVLSRISGLGITAQNKNELYYDVANKTRTAMDKFRHYGTVALGEQLNSAFDQGNLKSYAMLIKWVYKKCNVVKTAESMHDYFKEMDQAINGDGDMDCRILQYRMVMNKLYVHAEPANIVEFSDIEGEDLFWTKKESYTPNQTFQFLYNIWKKMDQKIWKQIEDEFRSEIGGTNYTKANWMKHKPRLFELIDQKSKNQSSRTSINRFQEQEMDEEEVMEIEIEPGMIMFVSPKGPRSNRPQNWKQRVQKYQAAAKRGQRPTNDRSNQRPSNNNNNRSNNDTPANYWNCRECPQVQGRPMRHKRGQKCPKNGFIPNRMIAMVQDQQDEKSDEKEKVETPLDNGGVMSFQGRNRLYNSSSDDQSDGL